jgi:hypothetical protein
MARVNIDDKESQACRDESTPAPAQSSKSKLRRQFVAYQPDLLRLYQRLTSSTFRKNMYSQQTWF